MDRDFKHHLKLSKRASSNSFPRVFFLSRHSVLPPYARATPLFPRYFQHPVKERSPKFIQTDCIIERNQCIFIWKSNPIRSIHLKLLSALARETFDSIQFDPILFDLIRLYLSETAFSRSVSGGWVIEW